MRLIGLFLSAWTTLKGGTGSSGSHAHRDHNTTTRRLGSSIDAVYVVRRPFLHTNHAVCDSIRQAT